MTAGTYTMGQLLRRARKDAGLSHDRLAAAANTSRSHLIKLEKGIHKPGPELLARIAEATGKDETFFTGSATDEEEESEAAMSLDDFLRLKVRALIRDELRAATS